MNFAIQLIKDDDDTIISRFQYLERIESGLSNVNGFCFHSIVFSFFFILHVLHEIFVNVESERREMVTVAIHESNFRIM